ncbi:anthrone oxygenase family protein [Dongia sp. agr-C8]
MATPSWLFILTLLAALGSGIMAGLFFAFSTFIMQALAKRPAPVGIAAMQSINETILKPIFFLLFFGTALLSLILAIMAAIAWSDAGSSWRLAGSLLYLAGSIGITMRWNVPLNNGLARVTPESAEGATVWAHYLRVWTWWNHLRTIACIAATGSFILGMP